MFREKDGKKQQSREKDFLIQTEMGKGKGGRIYGKNGTKREELPKKKDRIGVQERWDRIIKNIREVGRKLKMVKEIRKG